MVRGGCKCGNYPQTSPRPKGVTTCEPINAVSRPPARPHLARHLSQELTQRSSVVSSFPAVFSNRISTLSDRWIVLEVQVPVLDPNIT